MYSPMLCLNSLSIIPKRTGSARFFTDELSAMVGTLSGRSSVGEHRPALWGLFNFWAGEAICSLGGKRQKIKLG